MTYGSIFTYLDSFLKTGHIVKKDFRGDNEKVRNERVLLQLGCIDINHTNKKNEALMLIDTDTTSACDCLI